ncbi:LytTR family DNA-binding domain-containing protein [Fibrella forsythiae]|uniref:LytTR family transcriptional regulator n=1 Tax=Fibrella forsythiae TaxID=2817061 RepID=A0ABS3JBF0_9BACT|nr:LytTR family DNA-binding domain-containing protein [Fibrella forsythiae]MBO0947317.1 LytTR family transcriptional regulator [Fibrella forsythiae]
MSQISHKQDKGTIQVRIMKQGHRAFVPASQIEYLKSDSNYCYLHFTDKSTHLIASPMGGMLSKVGEGFIRLHSRYLCNSAHIREVDLRGLKVIMQSGAILPIATTRVNYLVPVLRQWAMGSVTNPPTQLW